MEMMDRGSGPTDEGEIFVTVSSALELESGETRTHRRKEQTHGLENELWSCERAWAFTEIASSQHLCSGPGELRLV